MAKFLRESRIGKMIHSLLRKKDEKGKDIDVEFKFGVGDLRRVLDLKDSYNYPTIMSERLAKGMWCRMGFSGHINGKMTKTRFSKAYRFLMHCVVHSLSHRKGAYDETSDYIMNIITSLVLNRRYNISQTSFSKAYRFLMHCVVHSLSHRKGAYDETSDYIMNIITSLVLNRRYNISQVIFEYMKENSQAKGDRYIMYPRLS
ncbi:hypothetical protein HanRHA438_Chr05g0216981 [Helianthus annuus]|nr:hypothetical protein HanHA300_Chr05g0170151 [Helianthus annuus]KAJ0749736.1 hypothetical protein HanLR1_Chr05g0173611 [Helianthus annuus]KAJ0918357.1 hypothetical protein HanRHA438_Chr05g0216981 [Helianthus annuus]KAJ0922146.1 hypothetical protein HanPSC8_Chr05g0200221 [Helianthus annuus]